MKQKKDTIYKKITLLNQTVLDSMTEKDKNAVVKNFTENAIAILGADFGFAWWKLSHKDEYKLAYKSHSTPYEPTLPRAKASNYKALKTKTPFFDSNVKKENYESSDITPYMRSFIVIPIYYDNNIYGNLILCYKQLHNFTEEELTLAQAVGHTTAQVITIHGLLKTETLLREEILKTEFIANATHELRTPLSVIKGNVDLFLLNKKSAKSAFKAINYEVKHLSSIVSDLQLITSEASELKNRIFYEKVGLESLVTKTIERSRALAYKKNIRVSFSKIPKIFLLGNKGCLEKMLMNLIKNSIVYGNKGGHTKITAVESKDRITINITDNGVGISKEDAPHIFERFYRADKFYISGVNSVGLGLAIVKWIADVHGGEVSAKSVKGKGSVFSVTLPINNKEK